MEENYIVTIISKSLEEISFLDIYHAVEYIGNVGCFIFMIMRLRNVLWEGIYMWLGRISFCRRLAKKEKINVTINIAIKKRYHLAVIKIIITKTNGGIV